jgi:sec-independent protein translocase protein TatA
MFGLGAPELLLILVVALIFFGPSKIPQIGGSIGKAIRNFQGAMREKPSAPEKSEGEEKPT